MLGPIFVLPRNTLHTPPKVLGTLGLFYTPLLQAFFQAGAGFVQKLVDNRLRDSQKIGNLLLSMACRQEIYDLTLAGGERLQRGVESKPQLEAGAGVESGPFGDFLLRFAKWFIVLLNLLHIEVQNPLAHRGAGPSGALNEKGPPQPALWFGRLAAGLCPLDLPGPIPLG